MSVKKNRKSRSGPDSVRRWLYRLPLHLPAGVVRTAQRLLGIEWLVLETVGRRSGRPHRVVLDVVGAAPGVRYVQPAYGRGAAWVRNVEAQPSAWATIDGRRQPVRVEDVTGAEGAEVVLRFLRAHPWYGRIVVWFVGYVDAVDRSDDDLRERLATTPVFAVRAVATASAGSGPTSPNRLVP